MSIDILQYDEVTRLVEHVARTNPPPEGASFCVWFYAAGFKHVFSGPLYADINEALDETVKRLPLKGDDDQRIVWSFLRHILRNRLIRAVRPIVKDTTNTDALEAVTRDLDLLSTEGAAIPRAKVILDVLEALSDDQLSGALERLFLNNNKQGAELIALRQNEKLNALMQCCIQATKDAMKGRYANIGAITALLDKKHNTVLDPVGFLQGLRDHHPESS